MKLLLFSIFVITILLLQQAFAEASSFSTTDHVAISNTNMEEGSALVAVRKKAHHLPKINCKYACTRRCRKASRKRRCKRACNSCCVRCHCVPPGTYGNKHVCPCYATLTTHGNKLKCP